MINKINYSLTSSHFFLALVGALWYNIFMMLNPEETIKPLLLRDDSKVADLGAGSGVFTLAATKFLYTGKVYAVDVQRGLLPLIASKIDSDHQKNVEIVWGNVEEPGGTKLKSGSIDAVIFANMLFQISRKDIAIEEIKRILKEGGKLLVVDWTGSFGNMGPREEDIVSKGSARDLFEKNGFVFVTDTPAGDYHYGMIFTFQKK
ncbi:MAG: class I SAM-dependent methyltransferase [Candidatus Paceibacterota bacterium]|nr:class I SAM-dependent methyltransferase [Candidatus Paceibacterota bacterium]